MEIEDLFNRTLVGKRITYKDGAEHLSLQFVDNVTGEKFSLSITAERGSDLWTTVKKRK